MSRAVLITGGSRGIGLATARRLAAAGDRIVLAARSEADLDSALIELRRAGGEAWSWAGDVAQPDACEAMVRHALDTVGPIDVCVLAAGIGHWASVKATTDEQWRSTMAVNVDGAFYTTRAVLPRMLEAGHGHLCYVSSVLGRRGVPNMAAYAASKAAVSAFAESVAAEVKPRGIKVTVFYPGTTATGMRDHQTSRPLTPDIADEDRQLSPDDVADAIAWAIGVSDRAYPTAVTIEPRGLA
jgi:NAD(P)-dependent dehydrogenase (short-subunit alcohol dehydrogenase family)